jgi:thiazole/oxazole-forming peptide maturase SagD family component
MKLYNDHKTINKRLDYFEANITGIFQNRNILTHLISYPIVNFHYKTATLYSFEKSVFDADIKFTYHLSGYGYSSSRAFLSLMGESVERYGFVSQYNYEKEFLITDSYENLSKSENRIINFELINLYDYPNIFEEIKKDTVISWIELNDFKGGKILVPSQIVTPGITYEIGEKKFMPDVVSTGTASHENFTQSITNGICEFMQLDSFNMWWYYGSQGIVEDIDYGSYFSKLKYNYNLEKFLLKFNIRVTDISFDKPLFIFVCEISSSEIDLPKYTVGVGASLNKENAIYNAIMECLAILEYNMNNIWTNIEDYKKIDKNTIFDDLDKNVIYYSKNGEPEVIRKERNNENIEKLQNEEELIKYVSDTYESAGYIVITPAEFKNQNQEVVRVIIPELTPLFIPNSPMNNHPKHGKPSNDAIHPLP